jgi:hypothetical protein
MEPQKPVSDKGQKIKNLEHDLNDLRQGLTVVTDYYRDLRTTSKEQIASMEIDEGIIKPLREDDLEFEGIWNFHEHVLVADPLARVPCGAGELPWSRKRSSLSLSGWKIQSPYAIRETGSGTVFAMLKDKRSMQGT